MMRLCLVIAILLACVGCQAQQRRGDQPPIFSPTTTTAMHAGTPLSGPVDRQVVLDPTDATRQLVFTLSTPTPQQRREALEHAVPLATTAGLITTTGRRDIFLPAADLTRGVHWLAPGHATQDVDGRREGEKTIFAILASQATTAITVTPEKVSPLQDQAFAVEVAMTLAPPPADDSADADEEASRDRRTPVGDDASAGHAADPAATQVRLAVSITQRVASRPWLVQSSSNPSSETQNNADTATSQAVNAQVLTDSSTHLVRETMLVDLPQPLNLAEQLDEPVHLGTLLMPLWPLDADEVVSAEKRKSRQDDRPWLQVRIDLGTRVSDEPSLAAGNAMLEQSRAAAIAGAQSPALRYASLQADLAKALALLDQPAQRRRVLVYLASRTGASLTGDLALAADDLLLELLSVRMLDQLAQQPPSDAQALGWQLDRACLAVIVEQSGKRVLRDVAGVLAMHLGPLEDRPSLLEEILVASTSRQSYQTRMLAEHLMLLEDDQPSLRVGAWRWLMARQQAPAGYEPMASAQARQQALELAAVARQEDAAAAATAPAMLEDQLQPDQADSLLDELDGQDAPATQPQSQPQLQPQSQSPQPQTQPADGGAGS